MVVSGGYNGDTIGYSTHHNIYVHIYIYVNTYIYTDIYIYIYLMSEEFVVGLGM